MNGRVVVVDIPAKNHEVVHLSPIFDAHLDETLCDYAGLKKLMTERNKLSNHIVLWGGDNFNLVTPPDLRRYRPSGQPPGIAGRDDWLNATIDYVVEKIEGLKVKTILVTPGNHEDEIEKRTGMDVTSALASRLKCARGGYSGVLDLRLHLRPRVWTTCRIVWHHGAGGGRLAKGYNWAWPYFQSIEGWQIALSGHNHASRVDPEIRRRVVNGELVEVPVVICNCGSWVESYSHDARRTHYAERKGYLPQPRTCPLIRISPVESHPHKNERHLGVEYSVEV